MRNILNIRYHREKFFSSIFCLSQHICGEVAKEFWSQNSQSFSVFCRYDAYVDRSCKELNIAKGQKNLISSRDNVENNKNGCLREIEILRCIKMFV